MHSWIWLSAVASVGNGAISSINDQGLIVNTKFGTHVQINLGMDICQTNWTWRRRGAFWGVLGCHKSKSLGRLSNGLTDLHQIWYTSADSSGNGHRLNTICPSTWGGGVTNSKVRGICETAGPIVTKFGTHVHIHLGMDIRQTNCPKRHKGAFGGV